MAGKLIDKVAIATASSGIGEAKCDRKERMKEPRW